MGWRFMVNFKIQMDFMNTANIFAKCPCSAISSSPKV